MGLDIVIDTNPRSNDLRQDVSEAIVKDTRTLTAPGEPEKRHIEITLPAGMTYRAGDYLAVLPVNHHKTIKAVLSRFNLAWDVKMTIKEGQNTFLPTGKEMAVYDVLSSYVELNQPATQKNLSVLQHCAPDDSTKTALKTLTSTIISNKRISVFDILTTHPNIPLSFSAYLAMLPPMRVRQYSISSSPLFSPTTVTLTYAVLDQESKSGTGKRYLGTASNYLSELVAGDTIHISVRQSSQSFHPPHDVENIPLLMACAGSGLAPFRGFVQERAAQISAGRKLAPAILWIGCRYPDRDILYQEEFEAWQKLGAIDVRYAFSQLPAKSEGCKYVQDRVWNDIKDAVELWDMGARFFVCGNRDVGEGIRNAVLRAYRDEVERRGKTKTDEEVEAWFDEVKNERFASDVFA